MKHLKAETGTANSNTFLSDKNSKKQSNSLPPKIRKPNPSKLMTIGDERKRTDRSSSPIQLSDKKWWTGSTGGSSIKDSEIIRSEVKKLNGSPSPSPPSHPHYPLMNMSSEVGKTPKGAATKTPKGNLNNTQFVT